MTCEPNRHRPRRSALYLPASNLRALEKARSLGCDSVILDLEDAVAPDAKAEARANAARAVQEGGFGAREVVVRVNAPGTPWGADDLAAMKQAGARTVLLPKVSSAEELAHAADALGPDVALWAMVETPLAILNIAALAAGGAARGLVCFVAGTNDLAKDMRCVLDESRSALGPALFAMVAAARANGLSVLDGVFNDIADTGAFKRQCEQGVSLGFDGKTLIHPSQIAIANACFAPGDEAVAWARIVVNAFADPAAANAGVLKVEGRMVERLHLEQARETLAIAEAIAARQEELA